RFQHGGGYAQESWTRRQGFPAVLGTLLRNSRLSHADSRPTAHRGHGGIGVLRYGSYWLLSFIRIRRNEHTARNTAPGRFTGTDTTQSGVKAGIRDKQVKRLSPPPTGALHFQEITSRSSAASSFR